VSGGPRLLHFSEDPSIERFVPHVPATNPGQEPGVWAIDAEHAPAYWFPRSCPRGAVWANTSEQQLVLRERFQTSALRVQATELEWLERMRTARLFVYELDPAPFAPWPDADGQWIAREEVVPLAVRPVGDLLALHAEAGIELRFVPDLLLFWDAVLTSGLPFSGIRLRYAKAAGGAAPGR
jgi:hypothetical protein